MTAAVSGVLLSQADAELLAKVIEALADCGQRQGFGLDRRVVKLHRTLTNAASSLDGNNGNPQVGSMFDSVQTGTVELIGTAEAARLLGCTDRTVRNRVHRGLLDGQRRAGRIFTTKEAVRAHLEGDPNGQCV